MAMAMSEMSQFTTTVKEARGALATALLTRPVALEMVLDETHINQAAEYESREAAAQLALAKAQKELVAAEQKFIQILPKIIHDQLIEGKAVHATWVNQSDGHEYGPFAAYYIEDKLTVEPFDDYHQFKARFIQERS